MNVQCTWRLLLDAPFQETNLESVADDVMTALLSLEQIDPLLCDSAIALDLSRKEISISISSESASIDDGVRHAMAAIRTAIHAAGGATPEWSEAQASGTAREWSVQHEELVVS
jgi:hypothetical protein